MGKGLHPLVFPHGTDMSADMDALLAAYRAALPGVPLLWRTQYVSLVDTNGHVGNQIIDFNKVAREKVAAFGGTILDGEMIGLFAPLPCDYHCPELVNSVAVQSVLNHLALMSQ